MTSTATEVGRGSLRFLAVNRRGPGVGVAVVWPWAASRGRLRRDRGCQDAMKATRGCFPADQIEETW